MSRENEAGGGAPPGNDTGLDTSGDVASQSTTTSPQVIGEPLDYSEQVAIRTKAAAADDAGEYDPRPHEDGARRSIAYLLIGLLWLVVSAMFLLIAFGSIEVSDIKDFAVILGPVVTLVSAATGFYYGTKSTASTTKL